MLAYEVTLFQPSLWITGHISSLLVHLHVPGAVLLLSLSCGIRDVRNGGGKMSEDQCREGTAGQHFSEKTC